MILDEMCMAIYNAVGPGGCILLFVFFMLIVNKIATRNQD